MTQIMEGIGGLQKLVTQQFSREVDQENKAVRVTIEALKQTFAQLDAKVCTLILIALVFIF